MVKCLGRSGLLGSLVLCGSVLAGPVHASEESFLGKNPDKDSWVYAQLKKAEKKLKNQIERSINEAFEENVFSLLGESLGDAFGKQLVSSLSGMISVGPFLSMDSLLNFGGSGDARIARQIEVMTKILLEAIEASKGEIISAVEQQFQDETEARLNTIIRDLDIYNARSNEGRRASYWLLNDLISHANYVMSRIEIKGDRAIDNLHLYMTMASLQLSMQKEFTRWMYLEEINAQASEEELEAETRRVMATQIRYVNNFVTGSLVGSMDHWKQTFIKEFPDPDNVSVTYQREASLVSSTYQREAFLDKWEEVVVSLSPKDYDKLKGGYFSYPVGDGEVEFLLGTIDFDVTIDRRGRYVTYALCGVFDASGVYVTRFKRNRTASCPRSVPNGLSAMVVRNHMNSTDAFHQYLLDGYWPAMQMLDTWWELAEVSQARPASEVDTYLRTLHQEHSFSDLHVQVQYCTDDIDSLPDGGNYHTDSNICVFSLENRGYEPAEDVVLRHQYSDGTFQASLLPHDGERQPDIQHCHAGSDCHIGDVHPGDTFQWAISLPSSSLGGRWDVSATSANGDLQPSKNKDSRILEL